MQCSVDGCEREAVRKGHVLCERHYTRLRRHGDVLTNQRPELKQTLEERFWSKVDKNGPVPAHRPELGPCWVWKAHIRRDGYGTFQVGRKNLKAHTVAYRLLIGPMPAGHEPDHLCRNRGCVRAVEHLEPVTHAENVRRGASFQTHCRHGHSLADARIYRGYRFCRGCSRSRYVKKGRPPLATHCVNGHEFTPENTRLYRGVRLCRACRARIAREARTRESRP